MPVKKDIFRRAKELDPKLKKMANHYVHFNITDVVYYGLLLYEQSTIHTIFTYGYYDDKRKDIIHILHFHAHAFITKKKNGKRYYVRSSTLVEWH